MKQTLLIIGGFLLVAILIFGYKINSDLNKVAEAFHSKHNLNDSSFVMLKKEISPDEKYRFIEYQFDNGGFGYTRVFWSVIKNDSMENDLEIGLLPDGYKAIEWTNNNELVIEKWETYYHKQEDIELNSGDEINGVKIKLKN